MNGAARVIEMSEPPGATIPATLFRHEDIALHCALDLNALPERDRPTIDGETLFSVADASDLTGLGRRTLHVYNSHRRCGLYRGPKPTKLPGLTSVFYRESDLLAYLKDGHTGAPGDPNADDAAEVN
ncbi:hypothetical protein KUV47_09250 [Vannielia litorea]|uniref:helix-turn-helix transcriptional regulator n=1 Tax=Vannielia litorea TaxID=1217970 RepID=UPI001C961555|nr:hypothetical protein [Vannielia litorea]MBY6153395.1 hypothetical protein [Vannielia litorea]